MNLDNIMVGSSGKRIQRPFSLRALGSQVKGMEKTGLRIADLREI